VHRHGRGRHVPHAVHALPRHRLRGLQPQRRSRRRGGGGSGGAAGGGAAIAAVFAFSAGVRGGVGVGGCAVGRHQQVRLRCCVYRGGDDVLSGVADTTAVTTTTATTTYKQQEDSSGFTSHSPARGRSAQPRWSASPRDGSAPPGDSSTPPRTKTTTGRHWRRRRRRQRGGGRRGGCGSRCRALLRGRPPWDRRAVDCVASRGKKEERGREGQGE